MIRGTEGNETGLEAMCCVTLDIEEDCSHVRNGLWFAHSKLWHGATECTT